MTSETGEEATVGLPEDVERPEDDDHDLLTFGEAGARLEIEIRTLRTRLREVGGHGPRGAGWRPRPGATRRRSGRRPGDSRRCGRAPSATGRSPSTTRTSRSSS